jgi:hypothetical protein
MRFTCRSCGEVHEGLADLAFAAPYYYYTVPETERAERTLLTSDLCSIDNEDFFIRGCLEVPIVGRSDIFSWGAWCSVSRVNFDRYREVFDQVHQSSVGPFFGWFSSRLPAYPDTLRLKVMAHLRDHTTRPWFELETSDHPLSIDYREGITLDRLQGIYEANLHGFATA